MERAASQRRPPPLFYSHEKRHHQNDSAVWFQLDMFFLMVAPSTENRLEAQFLKNPGVGQICPELRSVAYFHPLFLWNTTVVTDAIVARIIIGIVSAKSEENLRSPHKPMPKSMFIPRSAERTISNC